MRLRIAALFGVALLTLVLGCSRPPDTGNPRVGISPGADILWIPEDDMLRELDLYRDMGFGWIRLDIDWHSIEPSRGEFDWAATDVVIDAARERGLRVLAMPAYSPDWAGEVAGDAHSEPADMADYARFVGVAVDRYRSRGVHTWEVWNEPNSSLFWKPRPDVAAYAQMLKVTSEAIRSRDPQATVLAGALAPAFDAKNGSQLSPMTFVRRLYEEGAAPYFDVLSVHPYTYPMAPGEDGSRWSRGFDVAAIHEQTVLLGDPKPLWITEFGAPTGTDAKAVSGQDQARILTAALDDTAPWLEKVFLYGGRDRGTDLSNREQNFGFVTPDFSDKPSRTAVQEALAGSASGTP